MIDISEASRKRLGEKSKKEKKKKRKKKEGQWGMGIGYPPARVRDEWRKGR